MADVLSEKGDPRGELITLDFALRSATTPNEKHRYQQRIEELRHDHEEELLGPLRPLLHTMMWDRGLLSEITINAVDPGALQAALPFAREAGLRSVRVHRAHPRCDQALSDLLLALPCLEVLGGKVRPPVLSTLADQDHPGRLHTLQLGRRSLSASPSHDPDVQRFFHGNGLTSVRSLTLGSSVPADYDPAWIGNTPVGRGLNTLWIAAPFESLPLWFEAFQNELAHLSSARFSQMLGRTYWQLDRSRRPRLIARANLAQITLWRQTMRADLAIATLLFLLPAGGVEEVEVDIGGAYRPTAPSAKTLAEAIAHATR